MAEKVTIDTSPLPTASQLETVVSQDSTQVTSLKSMLDDYVSKVKDITSTSTVDEQKLVGRAFVKAIDYAVSVAAPDVYGTLLRYFVANTDKAFDEHRAMTGIVYLEPAYTAGARAVYLAFRSVTQKYPGGFNVRSLRGLPNSGSLLTFLEQQA